MSVDWRIDHYDEVHSTQDIVKGDASMGEPEGKVVVAKSQTGGRGRHGREWVSQNGNLYYSILLRPGTSVQSIGQLALVIGVALGRALQAVVSDPKQITLKWPNDILLDGEKCAGILIETELSEGNSALRSVSVGIGINTVAAPRGLGHALADYTNAKIDNIALLKSFLKEFGALYQIWMSKGFQSVKEDWLAMSHPVKTPITVKIGAQIERGQFHGIDDDGNLLLHDNDLRMKTVTAGEVYV